MDASNLDASAARPGRVIGYFRSVCILILLLPLLLSLPISSNAQEFTCTTNNGTITITGYIGSADEVFIPHTINGLPVTSIGEWALYNCPGLTNVVISTGVTNISDHAFYMCTGLVNVFIPDSVTSIGSEAFSGCSGLPNLTIPDGVITIGGCAFASCTGLTTMTIPGSVTSVGVNLFFACAQMTNIVVNAGNSFYSSKEGVLFNKDQTTILECPEGKVGSYSIPYGVAIIGEGAFRLCPNLTSITIPSSVSILGYEAFGRCSGLTSMSIPDGVTAVSDYAFAWCAGLTNVSLPDSILSIGDSSFRGCAGLTSITIPDSVFSIRAWAFDSGTNLAGVYFKGDAPTQVDDFIFWDATNVTVYYLPGSIGWTNPWCNRPTSLWQKLSSVNLISSTSQMTDGTGRVRVDYGMNLQPGVVASVTLSFSSNGGASWSVIPQQGTVVGDYGEAISSGQRSIIWNAPAQIPSTTYNNNFRSRLVATVSGMDITSIAPPFTIDLRGLHGGLAVAGRVLDAATQQGLSGVNVSLAGHSATTDTGGQYSFSNVALTSGSTIVASKAGFATYTGTCPVPAGTIKSVPLDISLRSISGSQPVVVALQSKHDVLFISGVSFYNDYTAMVNWQGTTPSKVHFSWNSRTGPQVRHVTTAGSYATVSLDVGEEFHGSYNRADRVITVQAENSEGILSAPFSTTIAVIPLPTILGGLAANKYIEQGSQKIEWTVQVPPDIPDKLIAQIPLIGELWPDFSIETSLEYSLYSAKWEWFAGAAREETHRKRGRPPLYTHVYPYIGAGPVKVDVSCGFAAQGLATQSSGIVLDKVGLALKLGKKLSIAQLLILDLVPGGQVTRVLDVLKPIGIDLNSIQRVNLYGTFKLDADLMVNVKPLGFDGLAMELKLGPELAYEPDLILAKGRIYVGGRLVAVFSGVPLPMLKSVVGEIYGGMEFSVFGIVAVDEKFLFGHGTIWSANGVSSYSNAELPLGVGLSDGWIALPVKNVPRKTISRNYLDAGTEGFAIPVLGVSSKSVLAADSYRISQLDSFRLMKQSPSGSKDGGIALASEGPISLPLIQAELPVITNAFPYSEPCLAGYGQELMLLWVADNGYSNDLQYTDIRWSRFDGTDWSTPSSIVADTRAEFAPKVSYDGNGDAVAVWQKVTNPDFTNCTLSAISAEMEIVWSRWDRLSGAWSAPSALTTNIYYDGSPLLAGPLSDGDLIVTWTKNEANLLMGTGMVGAAENDAVLCSRWSASAHEWSSPEIVVSNLAFRLSQSFAGISNQGVYAWTADADGVLTNDVDQEVYVKTWSNGMWSAATRCTSNSIPDKSVRAAVSPEGGMHLVWQAGSNLVSSVNLSTNSQVVRADSAGAGFSDYSMTFGPSGNIVLLWQEMTEYGSDAHYSVYDPASGTWSRDATFFSDPSLERSFSPVWDSTGQLNFAYNRVEIVYTNEIVELEGGGSVTVSNVPHQGQVDIAVCVRRLVTDVSIPEGGFTVNGENYLPGDALSLSAMLHNSGDVAVSNASVTFFDGNPSEGGVAITNLSVDGWLEGAVTNAILSTTWVVPEPATNRIIFAVANPLGSFTEFTSNNNTQIVAIGGCDLSVSLVNTSAGTNGSVRVIAQVQNLGAPGTTNTVLAVRRKGELGLPLATTDVPSLSPGRLAQVAVDLPAGTQPEGEAFYTLQADADGIVTDIDTNNNAATFSVNLWLDADTDGIPDGWENTYFGGQTNAPPDGDLDEDGMSNYAEWRAGTSPDDPGSYLSVGGLSSVTNGGASGVEIRWGSVDRKFYTVSRAYSLVDGMGFSPVSQHIGATPPENTFTDTSVPTNMSNAVFYRVEVE